MNSTSARRVRYLNASDIVDINDQVTEGHAAVRDLHLLDSAILRPTLVLFGEPQFPTILDKAAAMLHSYAYHHLFFDGNKRTAVIAVGQFLDWNGYRFDYDVKRDYAFILDVAKGNQTVEQIRVWVEAHAVSISVLNQQG